MDAATLAAFQRFLDRESHHWCEELRKATDPEFKGQRLGEAQFALDQLSRLGAARCQFALFRQEFGA